MVLRLLTLSFGYIVFVIEESKDIATMKIRDLLVSLEACELKRKQMN